MGWYVAGPKLVVRGSTGLIAGSGGAPGGDRRWTGDGGGGDGRDGTARGEVGGRGLCGGGGPKEGERVPGRLLFRGASTRAKGGCCSGESTRAVAVQSMGRLLFWDRQLCGSVVTSSRKNHVSVPVLRISPPSPPPPPHSPHALLAGLTTPAP